MANPNALVDRVFEVLMAMYGSQTIAAKWGGMNIDTVKEIWAKDLNGYSGHQVGYAIGCLKANNFPPSLPEFLGYCEQGKQIIPLPAQRIAHKKYDHTDPAVIEARERCMASIGAMYAGTPRVSRAWAYRALRNHESKSPELTQDELQVAQDCIAHDRGDSDPYKVVEQAA